MSDEAAAIRQVPLADIARRLGMVPSGGRWKPCPGCGKDRVAVGERVISCFACGLRLDAVSAARRDGRTWEQAAEWAGVYSVPDGYRVPPAPMRLDWRPFWPDCHWTDAAQVPASWVHEVDPSIRARAAADRVRKTVRATGGVVEECAALHGAAAVLGWDVVGEVWG